MLNRQVRERSSEDGFTLVELVVVIVLIGVIGTYTTASLIRGMQVSREADLRITAMTELQKSGERITREIRMACSVSISEAERLTVDIRRDGQRFRYAFEASSGTLSADVDSIDGAGVATDLREEALAEDIEVGAVPVFAYRDGSGLATIVPSEVRDVVVTLRRTVVDDVIEWSSDIHLRNGGTSCGF